MVANTVQNPFVPATKEQAKLRMALMGASGHGKTWTALLIASQIAALEKGKIAMVDTEGRSARKYASDFTFDVLDLSKNYAPDQYIRAIRAAEQFGYSVVVIDSFSHAWNGSGGVLDIVDATGKKMGGNDWAGWSKGRPAQNALVDTLINANIHIIGTMRSKTEWALETDAKGKTKPVKVGLAAVQSADFEYEFDIVGIMTAEHQIQITKSRCRAYDVDMIVPADENVGITLHNWLTDGEVPTTRRPPINFTQASGGQSPTGQPGKTPPPAGQTSGTPAHWSADQEQIKGLVFKARAKNFIESQQGEKDLLKLIGKANWLDYPDRAAAGNAILAAAEALKNQEHTVVVTQFRYDGKKFDFGSPQGLVSLYSRQKFAELIHNEAYVAKHNILNLTAQPDFIPCDALRITFKQAKSGNRWEVTGLAAVTRDPNDIDAWLKDEPPAGAPEGMGDAAHDYAPPDAEMDDIPF